MEYFYQPPPTKGQRTSWNTRQEERKSQRTGKSAEKCCLWLRHAYCTQEHTAAVVSSLRPAHQLSQDSSTKRMEPIRLQTSWVLSLFLVQTAVVELSSQALCLIQPTTKEAKSRRWFSLFSLSPPSLCLSLFSVHILIICPNLNLVTVLEQA